MIISLFTLFNAGSRHLKLKDTQKEKKKRNKIIEEKLIKYNLKVVVINE